ncbi:MAG: PilT/PilU family type 4a pilus ATPase [Deltaproteobacteria bacterium]|nr:PilT/PilU family type 4a pilus ATPase [Deltaproteobacteria bacterium]
MNNLPRVLEKLLKQCIEKEASDLHLSAESLPILRIHGRLTMLQGNILSSDALEEMARAIMNERQLKVFEEEQSLDMAFSLNGGERFRVNVFRERGKAAMAIRKMEATIRTVRELGLPLQLEELAELKDGLVLVTGSTGSGKTTTLAAMIHQINMTRTCHILAIEDPVEYIHTNQKSLIHQRELYSDVPSFARAIRSALREDPDVILVGEMRDLETMRAAITAAETGHLVFSTLHTGDAVGALNRIVGAFPSDEQEMIRQQLAMVLRAVVAQMLLTGNRRAERVPAIEVLRVTQAVAHLIRTGKAQQLYTVMETGKAHGMQTLEQSLGRLVKDGLITLEDAKTAARDVNALNMWLGIQGGETTPERMR